MEIIVNKLIKYIIISLFWIMLNYWGWQRAQEKEYGDWFIFIWLCFTTIVCLLLITKFSKRYK